jgi:hypothetical protein
MKYLYQRQRRKIPTEFLPETIDFLNRIAANGGTISNNSMILADNFVRGLFNNGLWHKMLEIGLFIGGNLNAALVKLKYPGGGQSTLANNNFVAGDYVETGASGGLLGNGSTKFLNTGTTPAQSGPAGHAAFYQREDFDAGVIRSLCSSYNTVDLFGLKRASGGSMNGGTWGKYDMAIEVQTPLKGFYLVSRLAADNLRLYRDGLQIAQNITPSTADPHTQPFYLWSSNNNGAAAEFLNCRGSFYSLGQSLTATETATYYTQVQTLQTALTRAA